MACIKILRLSLLAGILLLSFKFGRFLRERDYIVYTMQGWGIAGHRKNFVEQLNTEYFIYLLKQLESEAPDNIDMLKNELNDKIRQEYAKGKQRMEWARETDKARILAAMSFQFADQCDEKILKDGER